MKVFVLGHKGMLGHVVARFLSENGCQVVTTSERYSAEARDILVETVRNSGCGWVVNAIGRIKQKSEKPSDLFLANSLLPLHLAIRLHPDQKIIHASTDCIFSGKKGNYPINGVIDAEDIYGISKALGEKVAQPERCWVIRTSIIGPELGNGSGLMGWFLKQTGQVNGYTNHFWNGITTLEWAKICWELMSQKLDSGETIVQAGSPKALSKFEILKLIAQIWDRSVEIEPIETPEPIDRTLLPTSLRPDLEQQLSELKSWYDRVGLMSK